MHFIFGYLDIRPPCQKVGIDLVVGVEFRLWHQVDICQSILALFDLNNSFVLSNESVGIAVEVGILFSQNLLYMGCIAPKKKCQCITCFDPGELYGRYGCTGVVKLRTRLLHIKFGDIARIVLYLGHFGHAFLNDHVTMRIDETFLRGTVVDVVACHFGDDGDHNVVIGGDRCVKLGFGRFDTPGVFAPDVHLPSHIEIDTCRSDITQSCPCGTCLSRDCLNLRKSESLTDPQCGTCLGDTQSGTLDVEVLRIGLVYQGVQGRVIEGFPPPCNGWVLMVFVFFPFFGDRRV